MYKFWIFILIFCLTGCETSSNLAPVVELQWQPKKARQATHVVHRGETLYAIAFGYDMDYRQLAALNHLRSPFTLQVGQVLRVSGASTRQFAPRVKLKPQPQPQQFIKKVAPKPYIPPQNIERVQQGAGPWLWPINGSIATRFMPQQGKKGIDIAGKKGEMVHATSSGVVAYAGNGLAGYGNLIIIKHSNQVLTAYGNNSRNLVKEGQKVKAGQKIAEIGVMDRRYWGVHFEIRKNGRPVNPLNYLRKN